MTNDELREATLRLKKMLADRSEQVETNRFTQEQDIKCMRTLITLAQTVIELGESCPKKKDGSDGVGVCSIGCYNQAITDIAKLFDKEKTK